MDKIPLNIADLVPKETTFVLSSFPEKAFTLCRWSLRIRAWATSKYTTEGLRNIFQYQKIEEIADMAFFMLKEKDHFGNSLDSFMENIVTLQDQIAIITALLGAVGIGEPEIEKINQSVKAEESKAVAPSPKPKAKRKTGAKSSMP